MLSAVITAVPMSIKKLSLSAQTVITHSGGPNPSAGPPLRNRYYYKH